jgi:hypothetical protein
VTMKQTAVEEIYGVTCGIASCGHEPNRLLIEKFLEEFSPILLFISIRKDIKRLLESLLGYV